nr:hypothetical protein [Tanacetum cinerariifolium]
MNTKRGGTLDWFVQKKRKNVDGSSSHLPSKASTDLSSTEKECQFNVKSLLHDLGLRTSILDYHPNLQDEIRREYISRGLCRPAHDFPQTNFGDFNGMGGDAFVRNGFKGWNRPVGFTKHVGKQSTKYRRKYRTRLLASLHCIRLLLHQGLSTRGKKRRAPKNHKLTSPIIQIDMINCCAKETTKIIIKELGEDYFAILADESSDVSHKEQMSLCLRIRGQGYDGASNMKGGINGLKTLILKDSKSAYYIHCFAHQLQLTLVAVSKKSMDCGWLFEALTNLLNVKLLKLAEFYPKEFSSVKLLALDSQLDTYIHDVRKDERFIGLKNIGELSIKLVELNKHESFDLVYLLIKLVLIFQWLRLALREFFRA